MNIYEEFLTALKRPVDPEAVELRVKTSLVVDPYHHRRIHPLSIRRRLKDLRHATGFTRPILARLMGVMARTIYEFESGISRYPTLKFLKALRLAEKNYAKHLIAYRSNRKKNDRLPTRRSIREFEIYGGRFDYQISYLPPLKPPRKSLAESHPPPPLLDLQSLENLATDGAIRAEIRRRRWNEHPSVRIARWMYRLRVGLSRKARAEGRDVDRYWNLKTHHSREWFGRSENARARDAGLNTVHQGAYEAARGLKDEDVMKLVELKAIEPMLDVVELSPDASHVVLIDAGLVPPAKREELAKFIKDAGVKAFILATINPDSAVKVLKMETGAREELFAEFLEEHKRRKEEGGYRTDNKSVSERRDMQKMRRIEKRMR